MIELREGIDLYTLLKQNKQEIKLALNTGDDGIPFIVLALEVRTGLLATGYVTLALNDIPEDELVDYGVTRSAVDEKRFFVVKTLTETVEFGIQNTTDIIVRQYKENKQ